MSLFSDKSCAANEIHSCNKGDKQKTLPQQGLVTIAAMFSRGIVRLAVARRKSQQAQPRE